MTVPNTSIIKRISGDYDLEIIKRLDISCNELTAIGDISKCTNLKELNISKNKISDLAGIETLVQLEILDASENLIREIPNLRNLKNLHTIILQGNQIERLDVIKILENLPSLRAVYFRNFDYTISNPVVNHPAYDTTITKALDLLEVIDGERIALRESAHLEALDKMCEEMLPLELPPSKPWLEDVFLSLEEPIANSQKLKINKKNEEEFKKLLFKCKVITSEADEKLESLLDI